MNKNREIYRSQYIWWVLIIVVLRNTAVGMLCFLLAFFNSRLKLYKMAAHIDYA